jgi:predicted permease
MNSLLQDIRYAFRQSLKSPGFAVSAVFSLMLGIGATTAIFSMVYAILLDPYPYKAANRIVHVELHRKDGGFSQLMVTRNQFERVREASSVEDVFFENKRPKNITGVPSPVAVNAALYSPNFFEFMAVPPILGRQFTTADAPGGNPAAVAVLSYAFWREHYARNVDVIGKTLELDQVPYTVIGVLPPRFTWGDSDVYLISPSAGNPYQYVLAYPRLKPQTTYSAAEAELQVMVDRFAQEDPKNYPQDTRVKIVSLNDELLGSFAGTIGFLFGAVLVLLAIGCTNVSNLLLARGIARQQEFAIRMAVGARRRRLIRQLLTESVLLSLIGAALGILTAYWGVRIVSTMMPPDFIPREADIQLNGAVLIFSIVITVVTGILFGLAPAWQVSRPNVGPSLRASGWVGASRSGVPRMHRLPIAGQVALTFLLLAGASGAIKAFLTRVNAPLGFDPNNVFQMFVELPRKAWPDPIDQTALLNELESVRQSVAEAPGVDDAAVSLTWLPLRRERTLRIDVHSKPALSDARAAVMEVSTQILSVLRIPLMMGRMFDDNELRSRVPVALVNQAFVNQYLSGLQPIGQIVQFQRAQFVADLPLEVIGVVGDAINNEFEPALPAVFLPYSLGSNRPGELLFVRTSGDPATAMRSVRGRLSEIKPGVIVTQVRTFQRSLETYGWGKERLAATIFVVYAVIALVLAGTGIYGVVSFAATQQQQALGIRLALGASRRSVVGVVLRSTSAMLVVGIGAGLTLSGILSPVLSSWSGGVLWDPFALLAAVIILVLVAAIACVFPAWRVASMDPLQILRAD